MTSNRRVESEMQTVGLIEIVDGSRLNDSELDQGDKLRLLEVFHSRMMASDFRVEAIGLMELATKKLPGCPYFQITVTEEEEEYRSGNKVEYQSVVTTAQVWIEHAGHGCGHLAVLNAKHYGEYAIDVIADIVDDLGVMAARYLKRYLAGG